MTLDEFIRQVMERMPAGKDVHFEVAIRTAYKRLDVVESGETKIKFTLKQEAKARNPETDRMLKEMIESQKES